MNRAVGIICSVGLVCVAVASHVKVSLAGTLSEGVDLSGIEVLEQDRRAISHARVEVESQAQKMLQSGIANMVGLEVA